MEILKSTLLAGALAGICLLENTIPYEGCKIAIFILACVISCDIFKNGLKGIKNRIITDGLLMVLPVALTAAYGVIYIVRMFLGKQDGLINADGLYITVIAGLLIYRVVIVCENIFDRIRKKKSKEFIKETSKECIKYSDGKGVKANKEDIVVGDVVILRQGEEIFFDGVVIKGESMVYEGMCLNDRYIHKSAKDEVYAGSINCDGAMYVKVTAIGEDTVLADKLNDIRKSVQYKKVVGSTNKINKISIVLQLLCMVFVLWLYIVNGEIFMGIRQAALSTCVVFPVILYFIHFIVDVCIWASMKEKIFINGDVKDVMEGASHIKNFVVDYDDVLTVGDEIIVDVHSDQLNKEKILQLGCMAVSKAKGLSYRALNNIHGNPYTLEGFKEYVGKGVDGVLNPGNLIVSVGTKEYMVEKGISTFEFTNKATKAKTEGKRVLYVAVNKKLEGILCLACKIDENAVEMINNLKEQGLEGRLLTKDTKEVADYYGKKFDIDKVKGEQLVRNKLDMLDELDMKGRVLAIANGIDNGEMLGTATVSVATSENYKEVISVSDCLVKDENKKYIATLMNTGKRYCSFLSLNIIVFAIVQFICAFKLSRVEDFIGMESMKLGNSVLGKWETSIAWAISGIVALLFAIIIDIIKKNNKK